MRLFPGTTLVDLGGKQAMTVVLAVDGEVTFAKPRRDITPLSEPRKQREEDGVQWIENSEKY